jgi:hypothetical protein
MVRLAPLNYTCCCSVIILDLPTAAFQPANTLDTVQAIREKLAQTDLRMTSRVIVSQLSVARSTNRLLVFACRPWYYWERTLVRPLASEPQPYQSRVIVSCRSANRRCGVPAGHGVDGPLRRLVLAGKH